MGVLRFVFESVRCLPNRVWAAWLRLADEYDQDDLTRNPHRGDL